MAEIRVLYHDRFLCRAICQELAGSTVSLKEIEKARAQRRKQVKAGLSTRAALVEQLLAIHQQETPKPETQAKEPVETTGRPRLEAGISMSEQVNEQHEHQPATFVVTKGYRLFAEMCDACRQDQFVGLGYGPPGTGKTLSAMYYARWNTVKPFLPEPLITYAGRESRSMGFTPTDPLPSLPPRWKPPSSSLGPCSIRPLLQPLPDASKKR